MEQQAITWPAACSTVKVFPRQNFVALSAFIFYNNDEPHTVQTK